MGGKEVSYGDIYLLLKFVPIMSGEDYIFQPISIMNESKAEKSSRRGDYLTRNGYRFHSVPSYGVHSVEKMKKRYISSEKKESISR